MAKLLTSRLVPSFLQHSLCLVVLGHCSLVVVMKFQDKFASLQQFKTAPMAEKSFKYVVVVFDKISSKFCCNLWIHLNFHGFT